MSTVPKYFIQTLEDGSVTAQKLAAESVITSKIKDKNVTPPKLAEGVDWDLSGSTLTVATPTLPGHATTKGYVDTELAKIGLHWKEACRVASTGLMASHAKAFAYDAGTQRWTATNYGAFSMEGVTLQVGDRVLVKAETGGTQPYNGIFEVTAVGSPSVYAAMVRSDDANTSTNFVPGFAVFINDGSTNADTVYGLTTNAPITLDTTPLTFVQQAHLSELVAGDGLTKTGNTIDVGAGDGIQSDADSVTVKLNSNALSKSGAGLAVVADAAKAIQITASGIGMNIHSTNPGLEFNSNQVRAKATDGLTIGATGIKVDLASNPGLELDGTQLRVKEGDGIERTAGGTAVKLKSSAPGLEFDSGDLTGKADGTNGIALANAGFQAKIGTGLQFDGSGNIQLNTASIPAALTAGDGIDITGSTVAVDLATNPGMEFSGNKLIAKVHQGIELTANGLSADLGSGLQFDGSNQIALDTSAIPAALTGGNGINITGSTVAVDLAASASGLTFTSNKLSLKDRIEPREYGIPAGTAGSVDTVIKAVNRPSTPTAGSGARLSFDSLNAGNVPRQTFTISSKITDITAGGEDGTTTFHSLANGGAVPAFAVQAVGAKVVTTVGEDSSAVSADHTLVIDDNNTSAGTVKPALEIQKRAVGGTASTGMGTAIGFQLEDAGGGLGPACLQSVFWKVPTNGSDTSEWSLTLREQGNFVVPIQATGNHVALKGGVSLARVVVNNTSPFNVGLEHNLIACDSTTAGGMIDLRLPLANSVPVGTRLIIKDEVGGARVNNIRVRTAGSDTLDGFGTADLFMNRNYQAINIYSDGANSWHIF